MDRLSNRLRALVEDDSGSDYNEYRTVTDDAFINRAYWDRNENSWVADLRGKDVVDDAHGVLTAWPIDDEVVAEALANNGHDPKQVKEALKARKPLVFKKGIWVDVEVNRLVKAYRGQRYEHD